MQAAQVGLGLQNALAPGGKGGIHRLAAKILGRGFPVSTNVWIALESEMPKGQGVFVRVAAATDGLCFQVSV